MEYLHNMLKIFASINILDINSHGVETISHLWTISLSGDCIDFSKDAREKDTDK